MASTHGLYGTQFHNSWRAITNTVKGRLIGCSDEWKEFENFYSDMHHSYEEGLRICRIDKSKPFSKSNCKWATQQEINDSRKCFIIIEYNGERKTINEWSKELGLPATGIRSRYHRCKDYTTEEILFGLKSFKKRLVVASFSELSAAKMRSKASKMISSYKCKDAKLGHSCDLTIDWLIENIAYKECFYCGETGKMGCDRIDNTIGHAISNVVPCCYRCNTIRGNKFTVNEMKEIGPFIKNVISKRNT